MYNKDKIFSSVNFVAKNPVTFVPVGTFKIWQIKWNILVDLDSVVGSLDVPLMFDVLCVSIIY